MATASHQSQQIVTFAIEDKVFGIEVEKVREIKGWQVVTPLPHTPYAVLGVINLRGMILPVYDLRVVIGMDKAVPSQTHVIIVISLESQTVGLLVDAVSDIIDVTIDQVRSAPAIVGALQHVRAIIVQNESMITLLNMASIVDDQSQVTIN